MINDLLTWVVERIEDDSYLDDVLARSAFDEFICGVYTTSTVPPEALLPYVVILGPNGSEPDRNFDSTYRRPQFDLHVYFPRPADGGGSVQPVNAAADRLFNLFNAYAGSIENVDVLTMSCGEPMNNDGESAFGRVIPLRCMLAAAA